MQEKIKLGTTTLILGDCVEYMRRLKDDEFDLAIVDPPYRDEHENQPSHWMRQNASHDKYMRGFGGKPTKEYFDELFRVSKNQIIWGANNFDIPPYKGFFVWHKPQINEGMTNYSQAEIASISEELGTNSKVFAFSKRDDQKFHPTQKPVDLYKRLISLYAKEGDRILDSHLGSGSSAIACDGLFEFVGCEIDPHYFNLAKERIERHQQQLRLF